MVVYRDHQTVTSHDNTITSTYDWMLNLTSMALMLAPPKMRILVVSRWPQQVEKCSDVHLIYKVTIPTYNLQIIIMVHVHVSCDHDRLHFVHNVSTLICRDQGHKNMVDLSELQYYQQGLKYKLNCCTMSQWLTAHLLYTTQYLVYNYQ